jgi:hypothetical protein
MADLAQHSAVMSINFTMPIEPIDRSFSYLRKINDLLDKARFMLIEYCGRSGITRC